MADRPFLAAERAAIIAAINASSKEAAELLEEVEQRIAQSYKMMEESPRAAGPCRQTAFLATILVDDRSEKGERGDRAAGCVGDA